MGKNLLQNDERRKKSFKIITKNGLLFFCNPQVNEDSGVLTVDGYSLKLTEVTSFSYDKENELIVISLIGEKTDQMKADTEIAKSYVTSLKW